MSNFSCTYKIVSASGITSGRIFSVRRAAPSVRSIQSAAARLHRVPRESVSVCTIATVRL